MAILPKYQRAPACHISRSRLILGSEYSQSPVLPQFFDRGESYTPAIYYKTEEERGIANTLIQELNESGIYDKPARVDILEELPLYPAEEYHQRYAEKNPEQYAAYRSGSGKEDFVNRVCQIREEKKINWKE
jgi:hypothetical protein